jgi:hypothetical protein
MRAKKYLSVLSKNSCGRRVDRRGELVNDRTVVDATLLGPRVDFI